MINETRIMKFARAGEGGTQYVTVEIAPDGSVSVKTEGFSGEACFSATSELERALGKKTAVVRTPEYQKPERAVRKAGGSQ